MRSLTLIISCLTPGLRAQQKPPKLPEQTKLATAYFGEDPRTEAGRSKQLEILARLDLVPELTPSQVRTWKKKLLKLVAKAGPRLKKKGGRNYFWQKKKRGLYLVGGTGKRPKGLLIGMHGGGAGSGSATSSHSAFTSAAAKLGWVAVFPEVLEKTEHGWTDSGTEEFVLDLVAAAKRTWKIDPDRIFFAGHSMGGYGSWTLGAHHADVVAAVAPSAGAPTPIRSTKDNSIIDVVEGVIPSLRNVPMVIYQSDDDPQVPADVNRAAVKLLAKAKQKWGGYDYEYWEVPGRGHALPPGGTHALLQKIAKRKRNPVPTKVVWQPTLAWKRHFYWLHCESPTKNAILVAEIDRSKNTIAIESDKDMQGLAVLLDDRVVDMKREVVVTLAGKEVARRKPRRSLATLVLTAARNDPGLLFEARIDL